MSEVFTGSAKKSIHQLVLDLRHHRAGIYWLDMLASGLIFWACALGVAFLPVSWLMGMLLILVGSLALYRAALFVHEIGHFSRGTLLGFEVAWNALIGWPLLFPSFFIQSHPDHHRMASFGTVNDPEYLPFATAPRIIRIWFVLGSALTPVLLLLRACLIVPASWIWPPLQRWLRIKGSRMTMNNMYQPAANLQKLTGWHELSEVMTALAVWAWILATCFLLLPWALPASLLVCMMLANMLNGWRTLHAHAYTSTGQATDFIGQLRDSTTFKLPAWIGELVAPVGQRFHAAHHLFPYLPYHALAQAHERVMASSWAGREDYLQTCRTPSLR